MVDLSQIASAVAGGDWRRVESLVEEALEKAVPPQVVLDKGLLRGMDVVGARFASGEMYVPEVLMAARAMQTGMRVLRLRLVTGRIALAGKIVLGTVAGDLHDIGKNLVAMVLEANGFEVVDLGVDVSPERFVEAVRAHRPDVLGMSALLTTTMLAMKDTIDLLKEEGLREGIKVVVGGAPVSEDFAREIGADGYAPDAISAADLLKRLVRIRNQPGVS